MPVSECEEQLQVLCVCRCQGDVKAAMTQRGNGMKVVKVLNLTPNNSWQTDFEKMTRAETRRSIQHVSLLIHSWGTEKLSHRLEEEKLV